MARYTDIKKTYTQISVQNVVLSFQFQKISYRVVSLIITNHSSNRTTKNILCLTASPSELKHNELTITVHDILF